MIPFLNSFFSYLLLLLIFAALAGVGIFVGITMRKKKNAALTEEAGEVSEGAEKTEA